ncbi:hypothetical protein, partial [Shigella flexneri]|uniref:hypothetical protein n=1 Tax=Shigella flexneri TaxID=623 RepID=UPI001C0A8F8E
NRSGLTGFRPNRPGPVPIWGGLNRWKFKIFKFELKNRKISKKFLKILQGICNLLVSKIFKYLLI